MHPMNVYYKSDGTGRDSYIVDTSGGFNNTGRLLNYKDQFKRSLRVYDNQPCHSGGVPYTKIAVLTNGPTNNANNNRRGKSNNNRNDSFQLY